MSVSVGASNRRFAARMPLGDDELGRRDAVLEAVSYAAESLLDAGGTWEGSIDEVLSRLGSAAGVSRVYIFQNRDDDAGRPRASQLHEWVAEGVTAQIGNPVLADLDYEALGWGRWAEIMGNGEPLYGLVRDLPAAERPELEAEDILAIALVPIMVGPEWWGFIGFDECVTARDWKAEITALRAAARTLSAAIQHQRSREELLEGESRYRQIVTASSDGLLLTDLEGRVVAANPSFCAMHGYDPDELVGAPSDRWLHPGDRARLALYKEGAATGASFHVRGLDVRKDGSVFPVEVHGSSFLYRGRRHVLRVVRDDTARTTAFELLEQRISALAGIAASLTVDQSVDAVLEHLAAAVVGASTAIAAAVQLVDAATGDLRLVACHNLPDGYADAMHASWRLGVDAPSTRALHGQELVHIRGARRIGLATPEFAPLHRLLPEVEWDDMVVVPLDTAGRHLGAMNLYYREGEEPSRDEITFLRAAADQGAVAVENARLLAEARSRAGLDERQRLARELHDSVSQALYGIALGARTARTVAHRDPSQLAEPLDYVLSLAEAAMAEMRALIFELRPESLEQEGLAAALEKQVAALRRRHRLDVVASLGDEPDLPLAAKEALYRIAQEALHNVVKHAHASTVTVALRKMGERTTLEIADDGIGFDASLSYPGHLGLASMRERCALAVCQLDIVSEVGAGTTITVRV